MTLFLIVSNVYDSVDAPRNRGFSYIEVWMVGIQATIVTAILEYSFILVLVKYLPVDQKQDSWQRMFKMADKWTFLVSFGSFNIFVCVYWYYCLLL